MMKDLPPELDLRTRKLLLQQRSVVLREVLAMQLNQALSPVWRTVDKVEAGGQWAKRHPLLLVALAAALVGWRPRTVLKAAGNGWWLWRLWQRIQPFVARWQAEGFPMPEARATPAEPDTPNPPETPKAD